MVDGLAAVDTCIYHQPEPMLQQAFCLRDAGSRLHKLGQKLGVLGSDLYDVGEVPSRHHQHVHGSLRVDVPHCQNVVV